MIKNSRFQLKKTQIITKIFTQVGGRGEPEQGQREPHLLVDCAAAGGDRAEGGQVLLGAELTADIPL